MGIKENLQSEVKAIFATSWITRKGQVVPEAESVKLGNDAVTFEEAVVLYADLAESTGLVDNYKDWFAAEVYKSYLHCATKIIKDEDGVITAFDGDRVMAVYIGDRMRSRAGKTALKINHAVMDIINPAIKAKFPDCDYQVRHAVGVDMSKLFIARTGVRGSNDLVWVGKAANHAAKLCGLREENYASYITASVYDKMSEDVKFGGESKQSMWEKRVWTKMGLDIYRSNWKWAP